MAGPPGNQTAPGVGGATIAGGGPTGSLPVIRNNRVHDDYGTIGGLLLAQFGRVPEFGDIVTLGDRFEFRVVKANNRRIITLEMNVLD